MIKVLTSKEGKCYRCGRLNAEILIKSSESSLSLCNDCLKYLREFIKNK